MQLVGAIKLRLSSSGAGPEYEFRHFVPRTDFPTDLVRSSTNRHESFVCNICNFSTGCAISPTASPLTVDPACKLAGALPSA